MEVDGDTAECPVCGYEFPVQRRIYVWVAVILLLLGVLYYFLR